MVISLDLEVVLASARWGSMTSAASALVMPGYRPLINPKARTPPTTWAEMKLGADEGAMPAKVLENRCSPTVMAGLAKLVELVKK